MSGRKSSDAPIVDLIHLCARFHEKGGFLSSDEALIDTARGAILKLCAEVLFHESTRIRYWVIRWPDNTITVEAREGTPGGSSKVPSSRFDDPGRVLSWHDTKASADEYAKDTTTSAD